MNWIDTFSEFTSRLTRLEDFGNGRGRCACPVHGDKADLSLSVGDRGELLLKCFPRESKTPACTNAEVVKATGLDFRYLYPDWREKLEEAKQKKGRCEVRNGNSGRSRIDAIYKYEAEDNAGNWKIEFEVVRKSYENGGKDFPQRRPNPQFNPAAPSSESNPEFIYKLAGHVKWVLYRLRELREALKANRERWVFVVEGEKDVETARSLGVVATCNPGGALKWNQPTFKEELRGCNVCIIPDEDAADPVNGISPGIEHAKMVAGDLLGVAKCIRVLRFPKPTFSGYDLSDWAATQGTDKELIRKKLGGLVSAAVPITKKDEIDKLFAFAFDGKPAPAPQTIATDKTPSLPMEPAPEPSKSADPAKKNFDGEGKLSEKTLVEVRLALGVTPSPDGLESWIGGVQIAQAKLLTAVGNEFNPATIREKAIALAAKILRGVDKLT